MQKRLERGLVKKLRRISLLPHPVRFIISMQTGNLFLAIAPGLPNRRMMIQSGAASVFPIHGTIQTAIVHSLVIAAATRARSYLVLAGTGNILHYPQLLMAKKFFCSLMACGRLAAFFSMVNPLAN